MKYEERTITARVGKRWKQVSWTRDANNGPGEEREITTAPPRLRKLAVTIDGLLPHDE